MNPQLPIDPSQLNDSSQSYDGLPATLPLKRPSLRDKLVVLGLITVSIIALVYLMFVVINTPTKLNNDTTKNQTKTTQKAGNSGQVGSTSQPTAKAQAPSPTANSGSKLPYSATANVDDLDLTAVDVERVKLVNYGVKFRILAIKTVLKRVPVNTQEIYDYYPKYDVTYKADLDPGTKQAITFVQSAPKRDQIQYAANYSCLSNSRGLGTVQPASRQQFALLIMLEDSSWYCSTNIN